MTKRKRQLRRRSVYSNLISCSSVCGTRQTCQRFIDQVIRGLDFLLHTEMTSLLACWAQGKLLFERLNQGDIMINPAKYFRRLRNHLPRSYRQQEWNQSPCWTRRNHLEFSYAYRQIDNFYRRFIPHATRVVLDDLLRDSNKAPVNWTKIAGKAFTKIKQASKCDAVGALKAQHPWIS